MPRVTDSQECGEGDGSDDLMSLYEFGGWGKDIFSCLFILFKFRASVHSPEQSRREMGPRGDSERAVVRGTGAVQREAPSFA